MKEYISLTNAAMKMDKIFKVIIATVSNRKNASLGNSMLNHPGHVTLTSWIFKNFLPVIGMIELQKSGKF